ncbi:PTS sugar transporter subunit IIA [Paratissierella segnis]|jgi:mannitol/fructose-specific phosphotransferase system IIA component (Ntr-type)|uniref:Ascorbate-specific PTS system EIIA component n=1 Tax=Paratissierella segnis TaxID=2763679 RepID=A0A926IKX0_9FIRM|nr:PTS sugar transporter subunit IIA [Paratissierella segnis]MBC8588961.1 PTS sugar transporter subunit IIA [Paratissierella segnis]
MKAANVVSNNCIILGAEPKTWEEAIVIAGNLLVKNGFVKSEYVDDMIKMVKELGPYIVIAPGLAIPHARPSISVISSGISIVTLKAPVYFGNQSNDPVQLVIGLAGYNDGVHLAHMKMIADIFEDENIIYEIAKCKNKQKIADIFNGKEVNL